MVLFLRKILILRKILMHDLMEELGLKPGPIIGQILRTIQEAQAIGKVTNQSQALDLAAEIINDSYGDVEP